MIDFYCGIGETRWNHHAVDAGEKICVSPVKGRTERTLRENRIPKTWKTGTHIIQDSGAFQDSWATRIPFSAALDRQVAHAEKYNYAERIEYRVSYDLLIDEVWQDGTRYKRRWSVADAERAVAETIQAATYLANNRNGLNLILSAQGVDTAQYIRCAIPIIDLMDTGRDALGLGGWCIIGTRPKQMMPVFRETIRKLIPLAAKRGVKQIHIFGVIFPAALGELLWMCQQHDIRVSTDSTSPANNPFRGEWGYGEWRNNNYQRVPVEIRGLERARHVRLTREWLARLHETEWFRQPHSIWIPSIRRGNMRQLALF